MRNWFCYLHLLVIPETFLFLEKVYLYFDLFNVASSSQKCNNDGIHVALVNNYNNLLNTYLTPILSEKILHRKECL